MLYKKLRTLLTASLVLIFFCALLVLILYVLVQTPAGQHYLLAQLNERSDYDHSANDLKLTFRGGIGFIARDVVAESRVRPEHIEAERLSVMIDFAGLIKGQIIPSRIYIFRPRIDLTLMGGSGTEKIDDGSVFIKIIVEGLSGLRAASVRKGSLHIKDFPFEIEDLDFDVYQDQRNRNRIRLNMQGVAVSKNDRAPVVVKGTITGVKRPDSNLTAEVSLKTGKFPLTWIPWPSSLYFGKGLGEAHISLRAALGGPLSAEGTVSALGVQFSFVRKGKIKAYLFDHLQAEFTSLYADKTLEFSSLILKGPDISLGASSKIDFKDKANPHFILKIESPFIPLETFKRLFPTPFVRPWVEEKIFPILSGGQARLVHFFLNGTRDQLKQLHRQENSDAISMKIDWEEIDVLRDGGALPFERVSGGLTIEKGTLSISVNRAVFGNSTVAHASLDVGSLYGPPSYCLSAEGRFDLKDLKQQEKLNILPSKGRDVLQGFESMSGTLEGGVQIGFEKGWANFKVLNGKFLLHHCSVLHKDWHFPLGFDEAALKIAGVEENRFQGTGRWGMSEFQVSGTANRLWEVCEVQLISRIHMKEIMDHFYQGRPFPITQRDLVPCKATLSRKNGSWSCQGEIDLDAVAIETDFISADPPGNKDKVVFQLAFDPAEKLRLNDIKFYLGKSVLGLHGYCGLKDKNNIDLQISGKNLFLEDLGMESKNKIMDVKGTISLNARVQGVLMDPSKILCTGSLTGKDISFEWAAIPAPVSGCNFKLEISEKDAFIRSLNMRSRESAVDVHGHLQGWDGLKGHITVAADYLNVSDLIPKRKVPEARVSGPGPFWRASDIQLTLNARKGRWKKLSFGPLLAECGFRSGDFQIKHAESQTPYGTFSLTGRVKGEKGPERLSFSSEIKLDNQPIVDLEDSLGLKRNLEGFLTMDAALSVKGSETKDLLCGLTGSAALSVAEGKAKKERGIFFRILEFLNLKNVINLRMPDFTKEGFYFEGLEAHVNIKEGTFETEDLIFKSPVFNATAQGVVSLSTATLDLDVWVQTLETMDFVVGSVPIIGYILTEKENSPKGVFIYPLEVRGKWSDPEIRSCVLKNLGSGVINIFKRILLTPGRIFKEISEITFGRTKMNGSNAEKDPACDDPAAEK